MPVNCECHIAAEFPHLGGLGIISAALRTNVNVTVAESGLILAGPATGDLSITAYSYKEGEILECPGRAGVNFAWVTRVECDDETSTFKTYYIPSGRSRSYVEGDVTSQISMTEMTNYLTFDASAASGPHTPYLYTTHKDGHDFEYTGSPIPIPKDGANESFGRSIFEDVLPEGSDLYLNSFNWTYNPPNVPTVSYSFFFSYDANTMGC